MVDYELKDLFLQNSIEKQLIISYENATITNEDLFNQEMTLEESLCSDQSLVFGSCEASMIKFKVANIVEEMKGKWLDVKMVLEENTSNPFPIGRYKVDSDKFTADRKWKEVVAYDAMYDIINSDVIGWYNSVLPDAGSSMTVRQFRTSFLEYFDIKQEDVSLANDGVVVKRTVNAEELSGATVIKAICEMNGCFGHIGRDGIFRYIHLVQGMQGLYPRNDIFPADNLYPHDSKTTPIPKNIYIDCNCEKFKTDDITKLQIVNGNTGIISSVGSDGNCYTIESNILLSDKTKEELDGIGEKILGKIRGVSYQPFDAVCLGNPCFEVGDAVRFSTTYEIVESYILKRTLTGILGLKDSYASDGVKKYETKVNSIDRAVGQLNDKTDALGEDVESINGDIDTINGDIGNINDEIEDINENVGELHISLQRTESGLQAEVSRAKTAEGDLSSKITMTESEISAEVTRAKSEENILSGRITLTAEQFQTSLTNTESNLNSSITQTASQIMQEVSNGDRALQASIDVQAGKIDMKVDYNGVISAINLSPGYASIDASKINLNGAVTANNYFKINLDGSVESVKGTFDKASFKDVVYYQYRGVDYPVINMAAPGRIDWGTQNTHTEVKGSFQCDNTLQVSTIAGIGGGNFSFASNPAFNAVGSSGSEANVYMGAANRLNKITSSARRYKNSIGSVSNPALDPKRLYDIPVVQFRFNKDHLSNSMDSRYDQDVIGLIADDVAMYYPIAADYEDGQVENWNSRYLIPPMLSLIQEQHREIQSIQSQIFMVQHSLLLQGIGGI